MSQSMNPEYGRVASMTNIRLASDQTNKEAWESFVAKLTNIPEQFMQIPISNLNVSADKRRRDKSGQLIHHLVKRKV